MEITIEKVTPKLASKLLEGNTQNRNLSPRVVQRYSRDMKLGTWSNQGDPIRLSNDGTLLDGQHRLAAIIESGKTLKLPIVRGVDPRAMLTMDTGRKRKFADHLKIHGYMDCNRLAAAIRFAVLYECPDRKIFHDEASPQEMWDWLVTNHTIVDDVRATGRDWLKDCGSMVAVVRHYAERNDDFDVFADRVVNGAGLDEFDPAFLLRRWIYNMRLMTQHKFSQTVKAAVFIKAWNAYLRGEQLRILSYKAGGASPEKFPVILTSA